MCIFANLEIRFHARKLMQSQREQSIRRKLGSILGLGQSRGTQSPQRSLEDHVSKSEHSTFITDDVLRVSALEISWKDM